MPRHRYILFLFLLPVLAGCFGTQNPAPVTLYGSSDGPGSVGAHVVGSGDTLWSISQRYTIRMQDIAAENNLHAPFRLAVGQRLKLPPPQLYQVHQGDSLYRISRLFGITTSELVRLNRIDPPYVITPGQMLRLPSKTYRPETVTPPATQGQNKVMLASASAPQGSKSSVVRTPVTVKKPVRKAAPPRSSSKFMRPVSGSVLSSYGPKTNSLYNDGINIRAPRGTPVRAAENGVIVYAGNELAGSGNLVLVRHADSWVTAYAHLDKIAVQRGATIRRGQSLGTVGSTGSVAEPQLHFEIRRGVKAVNPAKYMGG